MVSTSGMRWRLRRLARVGWHRRSTLLEAAILLVAVSVHLRRHGYAATAIWLDQQSRKRRWRWANPARRKVDPGPNDQIVTELAYLVRLAGRIVPDATCLRRALVLRHLLGREGVVAVIHLGARPGADGEPIAFHAWVTVDGTVVSELGRTLAGYVAILDSGQPPAPPGALS